MIRKARMQDIDAVAQIYAKIHQAEEDGEMLIGWRRGIYPKRETAAQAQSKGELFVEEEEGRIVGAMILNQVQAEAYKKAPWSEKVPDDQVMVMHTLVISPDERGKGYGRKMIAFYETYALAHGCRYLRIDTNEKNKGARRLYHRALYREIAIVPCNFNGLEGVNLVLLEKTL